MPASLSEGRIRADHGRVRSELHKRVRDAQLTVLRHRLLPERPLREEHPLLHLHGKQAWRQLLSAPTLLKDNYMRSFLADVGGYIGLLLGESLLGLYDMMKAGAFKAKTMFK